ncbi:MAG: hypothetical protein CL946_08535, partial [Ectothiorhodospiraceae bacterium]|nr:hypothetical protein [Ectothiorhodospiraceae bacterium]
SNPVVQFDLSRVTARLWDGAASLPSAEGGDLGKLYVEYSGWKYLGQTSNGTFTFDIFPGNRKFRMKDVNFSSRDDYHNPPVGYYNMDFPVIRNIVQAKDQHGALVTDTDFQAWIEYGGWQSLGKDSDDGQDGIIKKGVLAGNRKFRMKLSHSSYDEYFNATVAMFEAIRNAVHVKDQCGNFLGAGDYSAKAWVEHGGWQYLGEDADDGMDGVIPCVLLKGNRKFRMQLGPSSYDEYHNIQQTPVYAVFDAVRNPVEVRDQFGNLLPDTEYPVAGKVWVEHGGWQALPDLSGGVCNTVLLRGNRKFRMQINHSSYDTYHHIKPTGICTADLAVFEALKDPVNLVDCNNNGIAGGDAWVEYGGWKFLGTTNAAGTIPNMSLLSGNRKFRMKHSGISQDKYFHIKWGAPPTLATFLASTLTLQFSGTIKYNYGGWKTYSGPMVFLAGSYNFTFDGMPKTLDLSGACNQTKSVVIYTLLKGTGSPADGGKGYINNGGWKLSDGVTDANGKLIALFNGLLGGTRQLRMNYDDGLGVWVYSQTQNQNIAANSYITFNLTTTHFQAWDGSAIVTQADGGDPNGGIYIDLGGWKNLGTLGSDGELVVEMFAGTHHFRCADYNYTDKAMNHNTGVDNYVRFGARTQAIELRDQASALLPDAKGIGAAYINDGGWKSLGNTSGGVVDVALLHGTWHLQMRMNHTDQTKNVNVAGGPAVFTAQTNAVELRDEGLALVPDAKAIGAAYINDGGWKHLGNTSGGVVDITLLTGTWHMQMRLNHTDQTSNFNLAGGPAVFNARNNTIELRDENAALVPDAKGIAEAFIDDGGWKSLGNTSGGVVDITLLTGTWHLQMRMNHTVQTKNVNIAPAAAVFYARNNAIKVEDENGNLLQDADGIAAAYINDGGWKSLGSTSNGIVNITLLEGTWHLQTRMNHTVQTFNHNLASGQAIFDALVQAIRLEDGAANGLANGTAYINDGGWKLLGTTDATGWVPNVALLAGTNHFRMDYDPGGGTITKTKNVALKHVPLTPAIFVWDGANLNKDTNPDASAPAEFTLEQNYPNPFNPTTSVSFTVPEEAYVTIVVYDLLGNEITRLADGTMNPGTYTAVWDGTNANGEIVASGKYLYKLLSGKTTLVKTMTFMK